MPLGLRNLNDFLTLLSMRLSGCPDNIVALYLREGARAFAERSESLVESLTMNSLSTSKTYTLASGMEADIQRILKVNLLSADDITNGEAGYEVPSYRYVYNPATGVLTFDFLPMESVTNGLVVSVSVIPAQGCKEFPAWWLNRYKDGLLAASESELKGMKDRPWSDPDGAAKASNTLTTWIGKATNDVENNYKAHAMRINLDAVTDKVGSGGVWP